MHPLPAIKTSSLRALTLESIREAIFRGVFLPGDQIRENVLAKQLGVSQSTVREALLQLEHAGLVLREANRRTTVTKLTKREICERVELRIALEGNAGVAASERMTADEFALLDERLEELDRTVSADDYFGCAQADLAFHRCFWEASGNRTLQQVLEFITVPLFAFISLNRSTQAQSLRQTVHAHLPIRDALRSRDAVRIREALRDHIENSYREWLGGEQEITSGHGV